MTRPFRQRLLVPLALAAALWLSAGGPGLAQDIGPTARTRLVAAARAQIGVTTRYDPAYVRLSYPGGDIPRDRGVCTDVLIRAYRDGLGIDLQQLVHEDMRANFALYPRAWGLRGPNRDIDHRRVLNLRSFFKRKGLELPITSSGADYAPGDIVTQTLPGGLAHVVLVAEARSTDGLRPLAIHNIGAGTRLEDTLFAYPITGHYRYKLTER